MSTRYHQVLKIPYNASMDDIKRAYKDIALTCHPDKLSQMTDEEEKNRRIERFKEASIAYNTLLNMPEKNYDIDMDALADWKDMWYTLFSDSTGTKEMIRDTFVDIASTFIKNKIYPKPYYSTPQNVNTPMRHEVTAEVTYKEVLLNTKKKLRLILVNIDEPIFVDMACGNYPQSVKEYTDEDDNEHEIVINMRLKRQDNFDHILYKSGRIDLITTVDVSLLEYSVGFERSILHADGQSIDIKFPPLCGDIYEVPKRGINKGCLVVNVSVGKMVHKEWDRLNEEDKATMVRILKKMCD